MIPENISSLGFDSAINPPKHNAPKHKTLKTAFLTPLNMTHSLLLKIQDSIVIDIDS
ncbi:hypothetical protein HPHPP74_0157 [Helicobacter pylori Hp P-74]|nr:hypothetical protein HPHPP74_0157 [Helicobacter pylori Hp P-74]